MMERLKRAAALLALTGAFATSTAMACDTVQYLAFDVEDGAFVARLNGVELFDHDGGYLQGGIPMRGGMVAGDNTVEIDYTDGGSGEDASFGIHEGCDGDYPDETPVTSVLTQETGTHMLTFARETATTPLPSPDDYDVTDGSGALEALHALQAAVKAKDMDKIFAFHDPMFAKAAAMGTDMEFVRKFFTYIIERGELEIDPDPKIVALDGGRYYQMTNAAGEPPIKVSEKSEDSQSSWTSGYKWVRIDGEWGVVDVF